MPPKRKPEEDVQSTQPTRRSSRIQEHEHHKIVSKQLIATRLGGSLSSLTSISESSSPPRPNSSVHENNNPQSYPGSPIAPALDCQLPASSPVPAAMTAAFHEQNGQVEDAIEAARQLESKTTDNSQSSMQIMTPTYHLTASATGSSAQDPEDIESVHQTSPRQSPTQVLALRSPNLNHIRQVGPPLVPTGALLELAAYESSDDDSSLPPHSVGPGTNNALEVPFASSQVSKNIPSGLSTPEPSNGLPDPPRTPEVPNLPLHDSNHNPDVPSSGPDDQVSANLPHQPATPEAHNSPYPASDSTPGGLFAPKLCDIPRNISHGISDAPSPHFDRDSHANITTREYAAHEPLEVDYTSMYDFPGQPFHPNRFSPEPLPRPTLSQASTTSLQNHSSDGYLADHSSSQKTSGSSASEGNASASDVCNTYQGLAHSADSFGFASSQTFSPSSTFHPASEHRSNDGSDGVRDEEQGRSNTNIFSETTVVEQPAPVQSQGSDAAQTPQHVVQSPREGLLADNTQPSQPASTDEAIGLDTLTVYLSQATKISAARKQFQEDHPRLAPNPNEERMFRAVLQYLDVYFLPRQQVVQSLADTASSSTRRGAKHRHPFDTVVEWALLASDLDELRKSRSRSNEEREPWPVVGVDGLLDNDDTVTDHDELPRKVMSLFLFRQDSWVTAAAEAGKKIKSAMFIYPDIWAKVQRRRNPLMGINGIDSFLKEMKMPV
ncbi:hypothetical protein V5O48_002521 [Marasmius crinis-equi]|uniref:Uncharacterized protein n=1 Tax=Marasmius crinis-equi TaxID=585013 RepID=A0ABR3FW59_9AGAR